MYFALQQSERQWVRSKKWKKRI